ncbi:MAG: NAD(P)-binding domain-containing protein [Chloroflexi bacterium]|nr:NAD(P)-binding domain-containing protein [Chloroflexota bacterium]OJV88179.1 MAG: hypothetical protein BGO39_08270 [Chloroflexi bacterium 54-19]
MPSLKIAVLGGGNIGGNIGRKWVAAGHEVAFGVNDHNGKNAQALRNDLGAGVKIGSVDEALAAGPEVILLAVPAVRVGDIIARHAAQLDDKIIIDATNNFASPDKSAFKALQEHTPNAKIYRAFNNLGWENFVNSDYNGIQADAFYCGDTSAIETAEQLIADTGVNPVYLGGPEKVDLVDSFLALFVALAMEQKRGRLLSFKLLTRDSF